ncbi:MAG: DUF3305 domain-containing protein [Alphaproteobacteria bacterium]
MSSAPHVRIPVGVVVERVKSTSHWIDYLWRPVAALAGEPDTTTWTKLTGGAERASFYAGRADISLHATETGAYRDNLGTGAPALWVVLRPAESDPPYELFAVTADPSEGEAMTEAGNNIVEPVPMPEPIREIVAAFVAEHHVERQFFKRKRDHVDPESLARRRGYGDHDE